MADRYEVLAALIDANVDRFGDQSGYHHTVVGVLRLLHELEEGEFSLQELPANIYELVVNGERITPFDRALAPGELDPETGRYNANPA